MDLAFVTKKLVARIFRLFKGALDKVRYWTISTDSNIHLTQPCRIDASAKIQTKFGGSIWIAENTEIMEAVLIQTYGGTIKIGKNCSVNPYTIIYGHGNTTIGNDVLIAGACMIIPSNHTFSDLKIPINNQGCISKGITIENNVWLGHGCSVLDNVVIGEGSVIAAGSVVNKTIPPFSVAAGVPAKVIKKRA